MNHSVVVFLFTSSNHISNVATLQSIYAQNYPHIQLIVCNDCTAGFQSERLVNNFEHKRPVNIEHILFQENRYSIGLCRSQAPYWTRLRDAYMITLHAGETFTSADSLRRGVAKLEADPAAAAVVCGCELWNDTFKSVLESHDASPVMSAITEDTQSGTHQEQSAYLYDCMVIYRLSALRELATEQFEQEDSLCQKIVPMLLRKDARILTDEAYMCKYSNNRIDPMLATVPQTLGSRTVENIVQLLQEETSEGTGDLFDSPIKEPEKRKKRNIFVLLHKLSSVSKILIYGVIALLFAVAAGLFLNLAVGVYFALGIAFLAGAALVLVWAFAMLICNLYLKKNPQRMVA